MAMFLYYYFQWIYSRFISVLLTELAVIAVYTYTSQVTMHIHNFAFAFGEMGDYIYVINKNK